MRRKKVAVRSLLLISLLLSVGSLFPSSAFAAEVRIATSQVLPPGSNTCAPMQLTNFTPFVYDSELHSFEFSTPDSSYVAVAASVGSAAVPFNQMTRSTDAAGHLRVRAELSSTPLHGDVVVAVTLLSAKQGQPVCLTTLSTTLTGSAAARPAPSTTAQSSGSSTNAPAKPATPEAPSAATSAPPVVGGTGIVKDACVSDTAASRLWVVLLGLYALVAGVAASGQLQIPIRRLEWSAAAIVLPFMLLFGIWYFVPSCRAGGMVPVAAIGIALAALGYAYWTDRKQGTVIPLPAARS